MKLKKSEQKQLDEINKLRTENKQASITYEVYKMLYKEKPKASHKNNGLYQERYRAKQKAKGLIKKTYFVTNQEHQIILNLLKEKRKNEK
jgi:hypothetical protein